MLSSNFCEGVRFMKKGMKYLDKATSKRFLYYIFDIIILCQRMKAYHFWKRFHCLSKNSFYRISMIFICLA